MNESSGPIPAVSVSSSNSSNYPEPFAARMSGRFKAKLGNVFGLSNFGVNLTHLAPGAISALFHTHSRQDEFIYVLEGRPTLRFGAQEYEMSPANAWGLPPDRAAGIS